MELSLPSLFEQALRLSEKLPAIPLGRERIRNALRFKDHTLAEVSAFLRDYPSLAGDAVFTEKKLAEMLTNTCIETGSLLFSAGAPADDWREWCALGGMLQVVADDLPYALQLATIARLRLAPGVAARLRETRFGGYREQAVQSIIFHAQGAAKPDLAPVHVPLDDYYAALLAALAAGHDAAVLGAVEQIAKYWLGETSYGPFEPGVFPIFEPEINAAVVALVEQGIDIKPRSARVGRFLEAALG